MKKIDVFNGDADGICSLVQLRNADPVDSELVTGVKRDIQLMDRVSVQPGDQVTVLDVSLDKNREGLVSALDGGAEVFYIDHHFSGDIPEHSGLTALINTASDVCTSLLVDQHLGGQFRAWAVTGCFGDNLKKTAAVLASSLNLNESQLQSLANLGTYLNYNGYGAAIEDLHFPPAELFRLVQPYANPFDFMADSSDVFQQLEFGYKEDMASAECSDLVFESAAAAVYMLPNAAWARRVSGVFGNDLANQYPSRAHAVVTERADGDYLISVRAPLDNKAGADEICRRFPTGGGRKAAAGINQLPFDQLAEFIDQLAAYYS